MLPKESRLPMEVMLAESARLEHLSLVLPNQELARRWLAINLFRPNLLPAIEENFSPSFLEDHHSCYIACNAYQRSFSKGIPELSNINLIQLRSPGCPTPERQINIWPLAQANRSIHIALSGRLCDTHLWACIYSTIDTANDSLIIDSVSVAKTFPPFINYWLYFQPYICPKKGVLWRVYDRYTGNYGGFTRPTELQASWLKVKRKQNRVIIRTADGLENIDPFVLEIPAGQLLSI